MEDIEILRQIPYFANLTDQDLRLLAEVGQKKDYREGSTIIEEGELNDAIYFIIAGQIKVYLEKISGRELTLGILEPGNIFGEACLVGEKTASPKVVALRDSVVVRFNKDDLLRGMSNNPIILANILRSSGFKHSHDLEQTHKIAQEMTDDNLCQRTISIFEKRFALELEGIKLISKKIEDISSETSAFIKEKSDETISRVEQRSKEAIESSERRSKEVAERAESQAARAIDSAKENISRALEEDKNRTESMIKQVEAASESARVKTEAAVKQVDIFWKKIKRGVAIASSVLGLLSAVLVVLGYPKLEEVKNLKPMWEELKKDKEKIDKFKEEIKQANAEFEKIRIAFRNKSVELTSLEAIVLKIGKITQESQIERDELDRLKKANISFHYNRQALMRDYITPYNLGEHKPNVVAEAIDRFLKIIDYSNDKIEEAEKHDILGAFQWLLWQTEPEKDFRYRLKNRDNLILFGQVLKKRRANFYANSLLPVLFSIVKDKNLNAEARLTVAEALARLGESNNDSVAELIALIDTNDPKVSAWRKYGAAVALIYIQKPRGHEYLFAEMKSHNKDCLKAALSLGEAAVRHGPIKLNEADHQTLVTTIEEQKDLTHNNFLKDYATEVLARLKGKDMLRSDQ